jgi:hypothetical protein
MTYKRLRIVYFWKATLYFCLRVHWFASVRNTKSATKLLVWTRLYSVDKVFPMQGYRQLTMYYYSNFENLGISRFISPRDSFWILDFLFYIYEREFPFWILRFPHCLSAIQSIFSGGFPLIFGFSLCNVTRIWKKLPKIDAVKLITAGQGPVSTCFVALYSFRSKVWYW